jgi:hypothetical protein
MKVILEKYKSIDRTMNILCKNHEEYEYKDKYEIQSKMSLMNSENARRRKKISV